MTRPDPQPVTVTDRLVAQVRDELRSLNERLADAHDRPSAAEVADAVRSGPAVADGMTVTEQPAEPSEPDLPEPDYEMAHSLAGGSYSCPECPRSFTTQSGLSRHRRAKHEEA